MTYASKSGLAPIPVRRGWANVLIPHDLSRAGHAAFAMACRLAGTDGELHVHVHLQPREVEAFEEARRRGAVHSSLHERVHGMLRTAVPTTPVPRHTVECHTHGGPLIGTVLQQVEAHGAELLVVPSKGQYPSGWLRLVPTAYRLVKEAPCSVWLSRGRGDAPPSALGDVITFVGATGLDEAALRAGSRASRALGAPLVLVWTGVAAAAVGDSLLARAVEWCEARGVRATTQRCEGDPTSSLLQLTATRQPLVLVVGAGERGPGRAAAWLSDAAYTTAKRARCDVLVARPIPNMVSVS